MADEEKKEAHKSEVEILATALADSNKEANSSNKNTVRVLGVLLAFSVLGNFALAGLNIHGNFFGTEVKMGAKAEEDGDGPGVEDAEMMEEVGYLEMPPEEPPAEWCGEMKALDELTPEDAEWCKELYPELWEQ